MKATQCILCDAALADDSDTLCPPCRVEVPQGETWIDLPPGSHICRGCNHHRTPPTSMLRRWIRKLLRAA